MHDAKIIAGIGSAFFLQYCNKVYRRIEYHKNINAAKPISPVVARTKRKLLSVPASA